MSMSKISISGFSMKELMSKGDDGESEINFSENENENDSSSIISFNGKTKIRKKSKTNEESEISEFMKNSMVNEYDYDISYDDEDSDVDTEFLKDITRELGKSKINLSSDKSEERDEDEDEVIKRKITSKNNISNCYYKLKEEEPELEIDLNKGLTQMVDEKIKKVKNLPYYINNQMIEVLMLAEKPSLAKIIAHVLNRGGSNFRIYTDNGLIIYTYESRFKGKKAFFTVSSIRGHVYQDNFKKRIKQYYYEDDEINVNELYEEKIVKALKRNNDEDRKKFINIPQFLRNIAEGKDILCLWLDCDPEGENICYEVIHNVLPYMNKRDYQQIYRAQFNSLTKKRY
jgi:DNA topoisomerase-3